MTGRTRAYVQIHTAVLLYGLTGILGDLISLPKPTLVWWRMLFAAGFFLFWPGVVKQALAIPKRELLKLLGIGGLVAIHWVTFFGAIALTNVSVTLAVLATGAFFTAILEPIILRRAFRWHELLLGVIVVPGVALVYSSSSFEFVGILVALISAMLAALFSILNKSMVAKFDPVTISFVELGSGWFILCLLLPSYYLSVDELTFMPDGMDPLYLCILAFACTSFAYVINLKALQVLSTFTVNLTINMEPVYSIILAAVLLAENKELHWGFYIGAGIIISAVFSSPFFEKKFSANKPS
ncbi:MAG: DMT family transporter [Bacteroidota bacterium]